MMMLELFSNYYQAAVFEKAGSAATSCFKCIGIWCRWWCKVLDNGGSTFFLFLQKVGWWNRGGDDACLSYNTGGLKTVALSQNQWWAIRVADTNKRYCNEL
jgi:hypothetical protein